MRSPEQPITLAEVQAQLRTLVQNLAAYSLAPRLRELVDAIRPGRNT